MVKTVSPIKLKEMLLDGQELAVIDVREQGDYANGHILLSCCIPSSRIELDIHALVPRLGTRIVMVDDTASRPLGIANKAAERLYELGYSDISILAGGIEGWHAAGFEVYSGVNVLSKAFGEFVESSYQTPRISAQALKSKMDAGDNMVIFDARPKEEYEKMNIPGAINVPGAELVHRFFDLVPDDQKQVIVNCAGRTRSIIGTQSLINAGVPNNITALENGTMGWHLAGFDLEHGMNREAPAPSPEGLSAADRCAEWVVERFGVKKVNASTLKTWQKETGRRTLYLLDVRLPEEFKEGHSKGAKNAPGGQLVQATDEYVAVRNARMVLIDDNEIRAAMTASWLIQMGWSNVYVLSGGIGSHDLVKDAAVSQIRDQIVGAGNTAVITPISLKELLDSNKSVCVIDFATSKQYRSRHIPGARWCIRSRVSIDLNPLSQIGHFILTSPNGELARLAAKDVKTAPIDAQVRVLEGGTDAWIQAGLPTESGMAHALSPITDVWYKPYEQTDAPEQAMQDYLDWEIALVEQIKRDETISFRVW